MVPHSDGKIEEATMQSCGKCMASFRLICTFPFQLTQNHDWPTSMLVDMLRQSSGSIALTALCPCRIAEREESASHDFFVLVEQPGPSRELER